jgi:flavin-dependent dehydrogenase
MTKTVKNIIEFYKEQLYFISSLIHYQTNSIIIADMLKLLEFNIQECMDLRQSIERGLKKDLREIQNLEFEFMQLRDEAENASNFCEIRKKLYDTTDLPDYPDYEQIQKYYEHQHPEIIEHFVHFNRTLELLMRVDLGEITQPDIEKLKSFLNLLTAKKMQGDDLYKTIDNLYTQLVRTKQSKIDLLCSAYKKMIPINIEDPKFKIRFFAISQQILKNPFEPPIAISEVLAELSSEIDPNLNKLLVELSSKLSETKETKKSFWDYRPLIEKELNELAIKNGLLPYLFDCKIEGLKHILEHEMKFNELERDSNENLIVGAGPAGLIRAIYCSIKGAPFKLIEKRKADKNPRPNTVTLGKWDPKELDILSFTGALTDLENKISFGHTRDMYIEVRLGDLEKSMEKILLKLSKDPQTNIIQFENEICDINKEDLRLKNNHYSEKIKPKIVFVTDGANSATRDKLGINQIKLSIPSYLVFSIFKDSESNQTVFESEWYKISSALRGLWLGLQILIYSVFTGRTIESSYSLLVDGGPSGLFCIPSQDYLIQIYRYEESMQIKEQINEILYLKKLIEYHKIIAKDPEKVKDLELKIHALEAEMSNEFSKQAKSKYGLLDFLLSCFNPKGHSMRPLPMTLKENIPVEVVITRAQRSLIDIQDTTFMIRGDAAHTTDPFSGTGCKTALEELLADQYFLNSERNALDKSIMNWGQKHYLSKMHNEAFWERLDYFENSETLERYADIAFNKEALPDDIRGNFLSLISRIIGGKELTKRDVNDAAAFYLTLFNENQEVTTAYPSAQLSPEKQIPVSQTKARTFFWTALKEGINPTEETKIKNSRVC